MRAKRITANLPVADIEAAKSIYTARPRMKKPWHWATRSSIRCRPKLGVFADSWYGHRAATSSTSCITRTHRPASKVATLNGTHGQGISGDRGSAHVPVDPQDQDGHGSSQR